METTVPGLGPGMRAVVNISDLAFGGEGVARVDGFVVFVPWVVPGEEVEIEVIEAKKQYARARLVRVLKESPHRVAPRCPYFGDCGGCQYQHIDYAQQLAWKHRQIGELMQRLGGVARELVEPVVPCPEPYGYRNRLMIRSQWNKAEQRLMIGFLRSDSGWVVDVESCAIAEAVLNEQIGGVRAHPPPRGGLKVVLRVLPEGWDVPKDSFFQNNRFLLPALVDTVRRCLREAGVRYLVDAYCGVGFFGIELAGEVQAFVGVECDRMAIDAARRNARNRGVRNGEFVAGRAEDFLPGLLCRYPAGSTAVILDPPRVGCQAATLAQLRSLRPRRILYVSCHPATLARDLNALVEGGVYEVRRIVPLDMFPQTQHVECVADIELRASKESAWG